MNMFSCRRSNWLGWQGFLRLTTTVGSTEFGGVAQETDITCGVELGFGSLRTRGKVGFTDSRSTRRARVLPGIWRRVHLE